MVFRLIGVFLMGWFIYFLICEIVCYFIAVTVPFSIALGLIVGVIVFVITWLLVKANAYEAIGELIEAIFKGLD